MAENSEIEKAEESKGILFSRRSVFAGLGLLLTAPLFPAVATASDIDYLDFEKDLVGAMTRPINWMPRSAARIVTDQWVLFYRSTWGTTVFQNCWYKIGSSITPDGKVYCEVKTELGNSRIGSYVAWSTNKFFYDNDPGMTGTPIHSWIFQYRPYAQPNLHPSRPGDISITEQSGFYLGHGSHSITATEKPFHEGTVVFTNWKFQVAIWFIRFKVVDHEGRKYELFSKAALGETWFGGNDSGFGSAYQTLVNWYGREVADACQKWYQGSNDAPWSWDRGFNGATVNGDITLWARLSMKTVHFMLNDENGNTRELCSTTVIGGSRLDTDNGGFSTAYNKIAQIYDGEVAKYSDRWYEGNQWSAWDWGKKFGSKTVTGETWIWASIDAYSVLLYADGTGDSSLIARYTNIPVGRGFSIPSDSSNKARKGSCNLNADYGTSKGSGFIGWYLNPELTNPAPSTVKSTNGSPIRLYARNRATLRVDYAPDSVRPDPAADYRTAPRDDAPRYPRAMELPVFGSEPAHRLDGVSLPATGDWADQHCCGYYGEVLTLPGFDTVYERLPEGRWRTFRAEGWSDPAAGASEVSEGRTERSSRSLLALRSAPSSGARVQMRQDSMRVVRWVESVNDGVDTSM